MSLVMKFGGSSVKDAAAMQQVARLVEAALPAAPVVVLSAMSKTTNALFSMAAAAEKGQLSAALTQREQLLELHRNVAAVLCGGTEPEEVAVGLAELFGQLELLLRGVDLLRELSPRSMDAIASIGERLSTLIFCGFLRRKGVAAELFDARRVIRTDSHFGAAQPLPQEIATLAAAELAPRLGPGRVVVTQGYIGAEAGGLTTTLGRGGSDFSAALLGAALNAAEVQIWTDVEGVLTADPRIIPQALPIPELSFAEAAELAAFGARVLHPSTIQPAVEAGIPVTVRHTERPQGSFTRITGLVASGREVTALASRGPVSVLTVTSSRMLAQSGFLARLFDVFARHKVSVDLVATAEVSVSLTVDATVPLAPLIEEVRLFAEVEIARDRAIVAAVGERLKKTPGVTGRLFGAISDINVEMISMGANEINLSLIVPQVTAVDVLTRLHRALIE